MVVWKEDIKSRGGKRDRNFLSSSLPSCYHNFSLTPVSAALHDNKRHNLRGIYVPLGCGATLRWHPLDFSAVNFNCFQCSASFIVNAGDIALTSSRSSGSLGWLLTGDTPFRNHRKIIGSSAHLTAPISYQYSVAASKISFPWLPASLGYTADSPAPPSPTILAIKCCWQW